MTRPLSAIAHEIQSEWKSVSIDAKPYLQAMQSLNSIDDKYLLEDADDIVLRFLSNAKSWRGPVARRIKAELKAML